MVENTNIYVIDTSYILCYLMPDEENAEVQALFDLYKSGRIKLVATNLLPFEVINGLYSAFLKKRIDKTLSKFLADKFLKFPIELKSIDYIQILEVSHKYSLTAYDASYVALAQELKIPLLTLDKKLQGINR